MRQIISLINLEQKWKDVLMINNEISLYVKAAIDVVDLIKSAFLNDELPFDVKIKKEVTGSKVNTVQDKSIFLWFFLEIDNWPESFSNLNSVRNFIEFVLVNNLIEKPKLSDQDGKPLNYTTNDFLEKGLPHFYDLVVFPIVDIIQKKHSTDISPKELEDTYAKYRKQRVSLTVKKIINTPLIGFESEIKSFSFSKEFTVVKFSDKHKTYHLEYSEYGLINGYSKNEILESTHMIQWVKELPKNNNDRPGHKDTIYLIILALRLSNSSEVVAKFSFNEPDDILRMISGGGYWHFQTSKPSQFYETHQFERADLQAAKDIFEVLMKLKSSKGYRNFFRVVVNRYLSSLSRTAPEDSVIDLTICLESLLLANERDELKYRLSLRGAILIGENSKYVKKTLGNMYDDRSSIVHSGKLLSELKHNGEKDVLSSYRLITEKIIKKYLEVSNDFDGLIEINQRLDELCLYEGKIC